MIKKLRYWLIRLLLTRCEKWLLIHAVDARVDQLLFHQYNDKRADFENVCEDRAYLMEIRNKILSTKDYH